MKRLDMAETYGVPSGDLAIHGIATHGNVHWNLSATELIDLAVQRKEGVFSARLLQRQESVLAGLLMTNLLFTNPRPLKM